MAVKVGMVSLGCPKNQVDAEIMLSFLAKGGFEICADENECEVIIVNTCGFIGDAKQEAIDTIFEMLEYKENILRNRYLNNKDLFDKWLEEKKYLLSSNLITEEKYYKEHSYDNSQKLYEERIRK